MQEGKKALLRFFAEGFPTKRDIVEQGFLC